MGSLRKIEKNMGAMNMNILRTLIAMVVILALPISGVAQDNEKEAGAAAADVARYWIQIGAKQYEKGFYLPAEQSFLKALDYQKYLNEEEKQTLNKWIGKAHLASMERKALEEQTKIAGELVKQGKLLKARGTLLKIKDSEFLSELERNQIADTLKKLNVQLTSKQGEIAQIYNRSVKLYEAGQLEKARKGFESIVGNGLLVAPQGKTAKDYIAKIDQQLTKEEKLPAIKEPTVITPPTVEEKLVLEPIEPIEIEKITVPDMPTEVADVETEAMPRTYIEEIQQKRNIMQSYTNAAVTDAQAKADVYMAQGAFDKAREAIESAMVTINKNQMHLGEDLYKKYSADLKRKMDLIFKGQQEQDKIRAGQKEAEAIAAQEKYRKQVEENRKKQIKELLASAKAFQKQQRYEEALGQIKELLAIDRLNDDALILRDTLEDIVSFRKDLEVRKESSKQKVAMLREAEKATIPYAEDMTYPKDWRDIIAKDTRTPSEQIGQDDATRDVYKQLVQKISLSNLTPETSFSDAIDMLSVSVDPSLKIFVNWLDLDENADIQKTDQIQVPGMSDITVEQALSMFLDGVSGGLVDLGYIVDEGIIKIATVESLPSNMKIQVYDVTQLLSLPAGMMGGMMGGMGGGMMGGMGGGMGGMGGGMGGMGGGGMMGGGMGGMGGGGMGGMGGGGMMGGGMGGMGGMGGGMMGGGMGGGMGGMGGGMGGGGMMGGMGMGYLGGELMYLIQTSVEPESWLDYGAAGEGTINVYNQRKLVIKQTVENHMKILDLIENLREALGQQVSIEARFLTVTEEFLERIGLDIDISYDFGGKLQRIDFDQGSFDSTQLFATGTPPALSFGGAYGSVLDDLRVNFLVEASQNHKEVKTLNAPKATVLSGEMAMMSVNIMRDYISGYEFTELTSPVGDNQPIRVVATPEFDAVWDSVTLNIIPSISPDKRYVLLNIMTFLTQSTLVPSAVFSDTSGVPYPIDLATSEMTSVMTRVTVPDGGTLLIGGQKIADETEVDSGVPVLSKIPLVGRLFENRSSSRNSRILLILVKPKIMLQDEAEKEAIAAMESEF
ncbi:MAG: type II secretion system protein GspD [Planctomycetota bacterium]